MIFVDFLSFFFLQDLVIKYSRLLDRLADVDSEDVSSKISFYSATLSRAVPRVPSAGQLGSLPSDSSSSLSSSDALSLSGASARQDLPEEHSDFLTSSTISSGPQRRMTRSRSLDDMLYTSSPRQRGQRKTTLKRRVGSSKFYTEFLNKLNTGEDNYLDDLMPNIFISHLDNIGGCDS